MPKKTEENVIQAHQLNSLAVMGTVVSTHYKAGPGKVTVAIGHAKAKESEITIPFLHRRGGNDWEWWAPEVGEQVLVIAPGGNLKRGVVVGCLPYKKLADSITPNEGGKRWVKEAVKGGRRAQDSAHVVHYHDKTTVAYDKELHIFRATFLEEKTIDLKIDATEDKEKVNLKAKEITLDIDATKDAEKVTLDLKSGKTKVEFDAKKELITIESKGKIMVKAKDITLELMKSGKVGLSCKGLSVDSKGDVKLRASEGNVEVKAPSGNVTVTGSAIKLNC